MAKPVSRSLMTLPLDLVSLVFRWSADTEYMTVAECVAVAWSVSVAESVAVAGYGPLLRQAPVTVRASGPWSVPVPVTMHVPGAWSADCHEAD